SGAPYLCLSDGYTFTLTPAQFEKKLQASEARNSSEDGRSGVLLLKCPQCGQFSAVKALKCPRDGTLVPIQNKVGTPGKCPTCGTRAGRVCTSASSSRAAGRAESRRSKPAEPPTTSTMAMTRRSAPPTSVPIHEPIE